MQQAGYATLEENFVPLCRSNFQPLATLLALEGKGITSSSEISSAEAIPAYEKRAAIVEAVKSSKRADAFEVFVTILAQNELNHEIVQILKDTYTAKGGQWVTFPEIVISTEESGINSAEVLSSSSQDLLNVEFRERISTKTSTDSGLYDLQINTECQTRPKTSEIGIQHNFLTPMSEHLHDVYVAGEKLFTITEKGQQELDWSDFGFRIVVPSDAIEVPYDIGVKALIAGNFQLPKRRKLTSAVYAVSVSRKLQQDAILVKIQHCVNLTNEEQCHYLEFVKANCSMTKKGHPYVFESLKGGEFFPGSDYGELACKQFSLLATATTLLAQTPSDNGEEIVERHLPLHDETGFSQSSSDESFQSAPSPQDNNTQAVSASEEIQTEGSWMYQTHVYYTLRVKNSWRMKFMVTKKLEPYIRHVEKKHGTELWEKSDSLVFSFLEGELQLALVLKASQEWEGWKILLNSMPPTISKAIVDDSTKATPPTKFIEVIAKDDPKTEPTLHYCVPIKGINPKDAEIFILRQVHSSDTGMVTERLLSKRPQAAKTLILPNVLIEIKTCIDWFEFGACLGLAYETLEKIRQTAAGDVSRCKVAMIGKWLKGIDLVSEVGGPSWEQLASTLKNLGHVMDAERIRKTYL